MLLLALDTSGPAVSVAVHDTAALLARIDVPDPRRHAELLAPTVAAALNSARVSRSALTDVVVGVGPGPFTGLRVGVVTAVVLGWALGVPVHGICSLDGLAEHTELTGDFLVATDARRREVYWARYHRAASRRPAVRVDGPQVSRPDDVPAAGLPVLGPGAALYPEQLGRAPGVVAGPAAGLAALAAAALAPDADPARRAPLLPPEPLYLRRPDAVEPGPRKRVLR